MNKSTNYVYILISKDYEMFKIGKATNMSNRLKQLEKYWDFRLDRSFTFEGSAKDISNLEKLLHRLFTKFNIEDLECNDGYTEFFHIEALKKLKDFSLTFSNYGILVNQKYLKSILKEEAIYSNQAEYTESVLEIPSYTEAIKVSRSQKFTKKKREILFDFNALTRKELEAKYNKKFEDLKKDYSVAYKKLSKDTRSSFDSYLKMNASIHRMKAILMKQI